MLAPSNPNKPRTKPELQAVRVVLPPFRGGDTARTPNSASTGSNKPELPNELRTGGEPGGGR